LPCPLKKTTRRTLSSSACAAMTGSLNKHNEILLSLFINQGSTGVGEKVGNSYDSTLRVLPNLEVDFRVTKPRLGPPKTGLLNRKKSEMETEKTECFLIFLCT
jgi:hypothetical protein